MFNSNEWLPLADMSMTLEQMIEKLYSGELVSSYTEKSKPLKPNLKKMLERHSTLLDELVKKLTTDGRITPSQITVPHTNEDFIFYIIGVLIYVEWAIVLKDKHSGNWLKAEIERIEKNRAKMMAYSDSPIDIDFPNQPADSLKNLEETLIQTRIKHMTPEIMDIIKSHFEIKSLNLSKRREFLHFLKNTLK